MTDARGFNLYSRPELASQLFNHDGGIVVPVVARAAGLTNNGSLIKADMLNMTATTHSLGGRLEPGNLAEAPAEPELSARSCAH